MAVRMAMRASAEDIRFIDRMAASNTREHSSGQAVEHASSQAGVGKCASEQADTKSGGRLQRDNILVLERSLCLGLAERLVILDLLASYIFKDIWVSHT